MKAITLTRETIKKLTNYGYIYPKVVDMLITEVKVQGRINVKSLKGKTITQKLYDRACNLNNDIIRKKNSGEREGREIAKERCGDKNRKKMVKLDKQKTNRLGNGGYIYEEVVKLLSRELDVTPTNGLKVKHFRGLKISENLYLSACDLHRRLTLVKQSTKLKNKKQRKKNLKGSGKSYVYIVGSRGLTSVKIGVSNNYTKRLSALQTSMPNKLYFVRVYGFPSRLHSNNAEKFLHKTFESVRVSGEWFELDEFMVKECDTIIKNSATGSILISE